MPSIRHHHLTCFLFVATVAATLSGCATTGAQYASPNLSQLELGKSTKEQAVALIGTPREEETVTLKQDFGGKELPQPVIVKMLRYSFGAPWQKSGIQGAAPSKWANVMIIDNKVAAYLASSSFAEEMSDFDVDQTGQLEKGKSTQANAIALLGQPSGKGIYPFAASPLGTAYFYSIDIKNHPAGSTTRKRAQLFFNSDHTLEDLTIESKVTANPVVISPTPIPVYIPAPKGK